FVVGIFAAALNHNLRDEQKRRARDWPRLSVPLLAALFSFSAEIYPHLKSSLGGGTPVPVVVYLSEVSRILPGQELAAELLEESDSGLYVVQNGQKQALFIPR